MAQTRPSKRPGKPKEQHRQAAIDVLSKTLQALDPKRMGGDGGSASVKIATHFVDELTSHVLDTIETLLDAQLKVKRGSR